MTSSRRNKTGSCTFYMKSKHLLPIFQPIPYKPSPRTLLKTTVKEFDLNESDKEYLCKKPIENNNFIQYNKLLASNFNLYKQEQSSFIKSEMNLSHKKNLELLLQEQRSRDLDKMKDKVRTMGRWMEFRNNRCRAIDEYILVKRK